MRRFVYLVAAVAALVAALPGQALAWGPQGHETIVDVAYARLSAEYPQLADRFDQIIAAGDGISVSYVDKDGKPKECHARTREELANWPDCVRYSPQFKATAAFHFDDIAVCTTIPPMPPLPVYCEDGKCGSRGLQAYLAQLTAPDTSPRDRAIALAFVVHIVGDLHQPLHAEDNNDAGGNLLTISLAEGAIPGYQSKYPPANLHSLWDTPLVVAAVGSKTDGIAAVTALADKNAKKWRSTDADQWVAEAHVIAQLAYQKLPKQPPCGAGKFDGGVVDAAYVSFFVPKVRDQLGKASVRLADLLAVTLQELPDTAPATPLVVPLPPPVALPPVPQTFSKSPCAQSYLDGVAPALVAQATSLGLREICYREYSVGYSTTLRDPLWSAEHLTKQMAEGGDKIGRLKIPFAPDKSLKPGEQGAHTDYTKQGFDRGHMTPADDASTLDSQRDTFTVTNIVPQRPYLNEHLWQYLEASVNKLAEDEGEVWIITGPIFGDSPVFMNGRIAVPDYTFKAIYVPNLGVAVAYVATNDNKPVCRVMSIDDLATLAKLDPFPALSAQIKSAKPSLVLPHGARQIGTRVQLVPLPDCA